jgi:hypothetical protein
MADSNTFFEDILDRCQKEIDNNKYFIEKEEEIPAARLAINRAEKIKTFVEQTQEEYLWKGK